MRDFAVGLIAILLFIVIVGVLLALPTMLLWNWVMPDIFGLPTLDFWHSLGLTLLSSCLFNWGSFAKGGKK